MNFVCVFNYGLQPHLALWNMLLCVVLVYRFSPSLTTCPSVLRNTVDYTTHEVPLSLFGLGHDWTSRLVFSLRRNTVDYTRPKCRCSYLALAMIGHAHSVERLYPTYCGQARAPEFRFVMRLNPNSALAMNGQTFP